MEYLSNIELYYSSSIKTDDDTINLTGDEFHHAVKVMRNKESNEIFITDGKGNIFICTIKKILKDQFKRRNSRSEKI